MSLEDLASGMGIVRNSNTHISIREEALDLLAIDVLHYAQRANEILDDISQIVASTSEFYKCESGKKFREKFSELTPSFSIIVENIENYAYSLKNVKNKFLEHAGQNVITLANATDEGIPKNN